MPLTANTNLSGAEHGDLLASEFSANEGQNSLALKAFEGSDNGEFAVVEVASEEVFATGGEVENVTVEGDNVLVANQVSRA